MFYVMQYKLLDSKEARPQEAGVHMAGSRRATNTALGPDNAEVDGA